MVSAPTQKYFLRGAPVALAPHELEANFSRLGEPVATVKFFPRSRDYIKRNDGFALDDSADVADHLVLNRGIPLDLDKAALFRCTALSRITVVTNSGHVKSGSTQGLG